MFFEQGCYETREDAAAISHPIEDPVWRTDTDQSHVLSFEIDEEWIQPHADPAQTIDESIPIYAPDDVQQCLANWGVPGQAISSSAFGSNLICEENQEISYGKHTRYPCLGEPLDGLAPTVDDPRFGCIPEQAQSRCGGLVLEADSSSMASVATPSSVVRDRSKQSPTSSKRKLSKVTKSAKPRISCSYPGCKLTFPRPYELRRHLNNFHNRIAIPCNVYGCNRIARPVPRVDKFREHMRKHAKAHKFVCAVEGCPAGPFDRDQLCQHLSTGHDLGACKKELVFRERLLAASLRITPRSDGSSFVEERRNCPLAFLGCNFRARSDGPAPHDFFDHLKTHDLFERSEGCKAILESGIPSYYVEFGRASCPVCGAFMHIVNGGMRQFLEHVGGHGEERRNPHIVQLWKCIRPFPYCEAYPEFKMIQLEYQKAIGLTAFEAN